MDRITIGSHTLHFGMTATRIWQEKCEEEVKRLNGEKADSIKAFAFLVYAGLCNYQDTLDESNYPTFSEAYAIAEDFLFMDEKVQNDIWTCFENSRAGKPLLGALAKLTENEQKKSEVEKNPT